MTAFRWNLRTPAFLFGMVLLPVLCAHAQQTDSVRTSVSLHSIALDPILAPLGSVHMEYEYALVHYPLTIGAAAWLEYKNIQDNWLLLRCLYYTSGAAMDGFAAGVSAGYHRWYSDEPNKLRTEGSPVAGVVVQYTWLMGKEHEWFFGTGLGAEWPLKNSAGTASIATMNANLRLVIGLTFKVDSFQHRP